MIGNRFLVNVLLVSSLLTGVSSAIARDAEQQNTPQLGVGAQYDTTHVYVAPDDVDKFVSSFLATFGGKSTKQVVATVTPTPSSTTSQLLQTPVGTVSLFGFKTPLPYPFGAERTGYLVTDMDEAIKTAKASGADVLFATFPDPIGLDAVIQWPGGVNMQLYLAYDEAELCGLRNDPGEPGLRLAGARRCLHTQFPALLSREDCIRRCQGARS
jgi:hypothetical protein